MASRYAYKGMSRCGDYVWTMRLRDMCESGAYPHPGVVLPPNAPISKGRQAIQAFWQAVIGSGIRGATLETVELAQRGDTAIEMGRGHTRTSPSISPDVS